MEEGRGVNGARASNVGEPNEYGTAQRPYSDSPAPSHKNDQFAGLEEGGMDGVALRSQGQGGENHHHVGAGTTMPSHTPVAGGTATSTTPVKSAFRPGSSGVGQPLPKEHSVSSNTYNNRRARGGGLPDDEEFFDKS